MGQLPQQWTYLLLIIVIVLSQTERSICSLSENDIELGSGIDLDYTITTNVTDIPFVEEVEPEFSSSGLSIIPQEDETVNCNSSDGSGCEPEKSEQRSSGTILRMGALLWLPLYGGVQILQLSLRC